MVESLIAKSAGPSSTSKWSNPYSDCEICGGDGYTHEVMDDGSIRTRPCFCRIERQNLARIKRSGLEKLIRDYRMDNFLPDTADARRMHEMAGRYISSADTDGEGWMYVGGAVGSGKTHMCTAVCAELMRRGKQVIYMEWLPVSREIKALITEEEAGSILGRYIDAEVLYIDDLFKMRHKDGGIPRPTESDVRIAFEILNGRYVRRAPTIITSEWYMQELLDIDEGTFSRLYQMARDYTLGIKRERGKNRRMQA